MVTKLEAKHYQKMQKYQWHAFVALIVLMLLIGVIVAALLVEWEDNEEETHVAHHGHHEQRANEVDLNVKLIPDNIVVPEAETEEEHEVHKHAEPTKEHMLEPIYMAPGKYQSGAIAQS